MRNRILEIAEQPARLRVQRRQLVVETAEASTSVPLEDLAVLVCSHPQVTYTQAVLNELMAAGGAFLTCDERRMPSGLLLPLSGNFVQNERFRAQINLPEPRRKQRWRQLVRSKIRMQAALLRERNGDDAGLASLIPIVQSGDPANVEARAARKYWTTLFGSDFRRDRNTIDHNCLLNYGYAVLRAATSRAVVAAGMHPTIGLHHRNKYNAFCLADDLMEPFRPLVDRAVAEMVDRSDNVPELTQTSRSELLNALMGVLVVDGEIRTLFDALARTSSSLVRCISGHERTLSLPEGLGRATSIC